MKNICSEWLRKAYVDDGWSASRIARHLSVSTPTVNRTLKRFGISKQKSISKEWLEDQYVVASRSVRDIASELGCAHTRVLYYLKKYGIKSRKPATYKIPKEAKSKSWWVDNYVEKERCSTDIADELGVFKGTVISYLKRYGIPTKGICCSEPEKEVASFIESLGLEFKLNDRSIIPPKEVDVFVPSKSLAIEYNGLYWHSFSRPETPDQKKSLLTKTDLCHQAGVQLLHIYEDEWLNDSKMGIWKSIIQSKLGKSSKIYARECQIVDVSHESAALFMNENHLQGSCHSSVKIGLMYCNEMVGAVLFNKPNNKKYEWEMVRLCFKKGVSIAGGASKMLKHFIQKHNPTSIVTYADLRYSYGDVYRKIGFTHSHTSKPSYYYFKNNSLARLPRYRFMKGKLSGILNSYDESLSESVNMFNNGYRRVWNCGNAAFVWRKS